MGLGRLNSFSCCKLLFKSFWTPLYIYAYNVQKDGNGPHFTKAPITVIKQLRC